MRSTGGSDYRNHDTESERLGILRIVHAHRRITRRQEKAVSAIMA